MDTVEQEVLSIFRKSGALLQGHFILRSGLHSDHFFQCAQVGQHMDHMTRLGELLLAKIRHLPCQTILAPAMGGLVLGQEIARQWGKRYLFAEKEEGKLVMRRGFRLEAGEPVVVVEDVITRGGRAQEAIAIARAQGAVVSAVAVLVDRSEGLASFDVPVHSLLRMSFPTWPADALPEHLKKIPAVKPGS